MRPENKQDANNGGAERFSPRYFRNLGAVMLAGWIGMNGVVKMTEPEYYSQLTSVNPITAAEKMLNYLTGGNQCPAIPYAGGVSAGRATTYTEAGFEFLDISAYASQLKAAKDTPSMVSVLDRFTQGQYGFPTSMSSESIEGITKPRRLIDFRQDKTPLGPRFIIESQQSRYDTDNFFRNGMLYVIKAFNALPKPVVKLANINSLELITQDQAATSNNLSNEVVLGDADIYERKLTLYPSSLTTDRVRSVLAHEIGHLLDETECGLLGLQRDTAYQSFNTFSLMYGNKKSYGAERNTISPYGAMGPAEDKAELYSHLLTGSLTFEDLQKSPKPIRRKAELLLARLEDRLPGISEYLLSNHTE
jgi:hypothetical protein